MFTSLAIREMQIKSALRFPLTSVIVTKTKPNQIPPNHKTGETGNRYTWLGEVTCAATKEIMIEALDKTNGRTTM